MEVTFGAVPMIILVFKGYQLVRTFMSDYSSFDSNAKCVLRDINTNQTTFKHTVKLLLRDIVEENILHAMLMNPESEHWVRKDLDIRLEHILGDSILDVKEAIHNTYETLENIREHLISSQVKKAPNLKKNFSVSSLHRGVSIIATAFISKDNDQMQANNIFTYSARRKIVTITKGYLKELKDLCVDLRNRVSDLRALLETLLRNNTRKRTPSLHPDDGGAPAPVPDLRTLSSIIKANAASQSLYTLTTSSLLCDCHSVYLSLGRPATAKISPTNSREQSIDQGAVRGDGAVLMFKMKPTQGRTGRGHNQMIVKFIVADQKTAKPESIAHPTISEGKICNELPMQATMAERLLLDHTTLNGPIFRLCIEQLQGSSTYLPSRTSESITLETLISDRHNELKTLDRILIATGLAHALLKHYSSPWVRNWGIKTIHYFERQEVKSAIGNWTPYLSIKPLNMDEIQLGDRNRDVFLLGLLLLQVGTKVIIDTTGGQWDRIRTRGVEDLCREMGPHYSNFVKCCLSIWSDRSMDMMEERNLKMFVSRVNVLEKTGRFFESGDD